MSEDRGIPSMSIIFRFGSAYEDMVIQCHRLQVTPKEDKHMLDGLQQHILEVE